MKNVTLSKRLQMLAGMVTPGNRLVDVGCDHGYLSIYLVQKGICPEGIAMDVRQGPLACAEEHVRESGLGDYIKVRLSDGLGAYAAGEAETMVCAGMGGRLMGRILSESMEKAKSFQELILQPQSELEEFREFLRKAGFAVTEEEAVCEEGKFYFAMKAVPLGADVMAFMEARETKEATNSRETTESKEAAGFRETMEAKEVTDSRETMEAKEVTDSRETTESKEATGSRESTQTLYDMFGELLLEKRHPILLEYLIQRRKHLEGLLACLKSENSERAKGRRMEVEKEISAVLDAMALFVAVP